MNRSFTYWLNDDERAMEALREQENGAELAALECLANAVLSGNIINAAFQAAVNAIVAKAVISGKLPPKKKGRPETFENVVAGVNVASRYYELRDGGANFDDSVAQVSSEFHKSDRQIMRLVEDNKHVVGGTVEERKKRRDRDKGMAGIGLRDGESVTPEQMAALVRLFDFSSNFSIDEIENLAHGMATAINETKVSLTVQQANDVQREPLADLDRLIAQALTQKNSTDIK